MAKIKLPKYLFKRKKPRQALTKNEVMKFIRLPEAGIKRAAPKVKIPVAFLRRAKTMVLVDKRITRVKPPNWVKTHIARHAKLKEVIKQLFSRMERLKGLRSIVEAKNGLNEIGRMKNGGRLVRKALSQKIVNKYLEKEG